MGDTAVLAGSTHDFPFLFDMDLKDFDSSWELGYPQSVAGKEQSLQRWFEGQNRADTVNQFNAANASVEKDDARLRCRSCEVQMKLEWKTNDNGIGGTFVTRHVDPSITDQSIGAWEQCTATHEEIACEFSSGVCFVEERRTWGYVTYVKKGCKQAQACYMQKYQNFLVEAGRQCWPEDNSNMNRRIAARPHDLKADEWIYNIMAGGAESIADSWANRDWLKADDGSVMQWTDAVYANRQFDNTFTDLGPYANPDISDTILQDDSNGLTEGFYKDFWYGRGGQYQTYDTNPRWTAGGRAAGYNTPLEVVTFEEMHRPILYANGLVSNSRCTQCCNTGDNCNEGWTLKTEADWNTNYDLSPSDVYTTRR